MAILERTDIHRPSAIVPADYTFVAHDFLPAESMFQCAILSHNRSVKAAHMARTGGTYSQHEHGGNCDVCGSVNAIYTLTFYHSPSNSYIHVGADCADKLDSGSDFGHSQFRKAISDAREAHAGKLKAQALLSDAGHSAAWDIYKATDREAFKYEECTITDIVAKLVRYGSISDKAMAYVGTLLAKIPQREAVQIQRMEEKAQAANCPKGRITVEGVIVKIADHENSFGVTTKMTVKHDSGYLVWGTMPSSCSALKGDRVKFTATVEPSPDDSKFGFFKRPVMQ